MLIKDSIKVSCVKTFFIKNIDTFMRAMSIYDFTVCMDGLIQETAFTYSIANTLASAFASQMSLVLLVVTFSGRGGLSLH